MTSRQFDRAFKWLAEVGKLVITLALITAGLALVLFTVTGVNPFQR